MKRIGVYFTFETRREASAFHELLTELRWMDPADDRSSCEANQVYVRVEATCDKEPVEKLAELVADVQPGTLEAYKLRWLRARVDALKADLEASGVDVASILGKLEESRAKTS